MSALFSLVLGLAGIIIIIKRKKIAFVVYKKIQIPASKIYKNLLGLPVLDETNWLGRVLMMLTPWSMVFIGIVLLLAAYSVYFGPIVIFL